MSSLVVVAGWCETREERRAGDALQTSVSHAEDFPLVPSHFVVMRLHVLDNTIIPLATQQRPPPEDTHMLMTSIIDV